MKILKEIAGMEFVFQSPIEIEEAIAPHAVITGCLLKSGISRKGRLYTIEELENIAEQAKGLPIEYGVDYRGRHKQGDRVGRILRAWLDESRKKVLFVAELFGGIARKVRKGWAVSIEGKSDGKWVIDEAGSILLKLKDIMFTKLQLLPPFVKGGVEGAEVHDVKVQESMEFKQSISNAKLAIIIATLRKRGMI